jgi:hypothetical protein
LAHALLVIPDNAIGLIDWALAGGGLNLRGGACERLALAVPPQPNRACAKGYRQGRADQCKLWSNNSHEDSLHVL